MLGPKVTQIPGTSVNNNPSAGIMNRTRGVNKTAINQKYAVIPATSNTKDRVLLLNKPATNAGIINER